MSKHHFLVREPNHTADKTVVIMGVARGGTSMVAGTVRELGVNLGTRLGENHEDPQFLPFEVDKIREVIQRRNEEHGTWGWKMPHSLQYIEQIQGDLRNPHYILVWRNTLATAISQVNRSDTTINNALQYSSNRLVEMIDKLKLIEGPVLLVNYEQAINHKDDFIDTLAGYLGVEVTDEVRRNCLRFIDPNTGYQQISETFYRVERVNIDDHPEPLPMQRVVRQLERVEGQPFFAVTGKAPRFIFKAGKGKTLPEELVLRFANMGESEQRVRLLFDYDWSFSRNMSHVATVAPGKHAFKVTSNGNMKRVALVPEDAEDTCSIGLVELRKP